MEYRTLDEKYWWELPIRDDEQAETVVHPHAEIAEILAREQGLERLQAQGSNDAGTLGDVARVESGAGELWSDRVKELKINRGTKELLSVVPVTVVPTEPTSFEATVRGGLSGTNDVTFRSNLITYLNNDTWQVQLQDFVQSGIQRIVENLEEFNVRTRRRERLHKQGPNDAGILCDVVATVLPSRDCSEFRGAQVKQLKINRVAKDLLSLVPVTVRPTQSRSNSFRAFVGKREALITYWRNEFWQLNLQDFVVCHPKKTLF